MKKRLVFATNNAHKLEEIRAILGNSIEILSLADIHCHADIPETADYRRTGYPRLFPVVVNNNPDITNLQLGARRMTYPLEEYEANGETIRAAVDQWLGGQDKMSTRLWWDCNPRIR